MKIPPSTNVGGGIGRGRKIRTFGMTESESVALPLGDTPTVIEMSCAPDYDIDKVAGVAVFEPAGAKVKVSCLTAWRYPYEAGFVACRLFNGVSKGIRTLGLQGHNLAL